jgi:prepilin-type N-terminal cleavage/methylation domain-containing protein
VSVKKTERRGLSGNGGFSLVELLVAVIILGIIVGPLLHTFVTGVVTASKSRKMGDATLAAQNISETLEATDLTKALTEPEDVFGGIGTGLVGDYTANLTNYTLNIKDIGAGKSKFNATVEFNSGSEGDAFSKINAQEIAEYSNMDAAYAQSGDMTDPDELSYSEFVKNVQDADASVSGIERSIALDVDYLTDADNVPDTSKIKAELSYKYVYHYSYTKVNTDGTTSTASNTWTYTSKNDLFPSGFDSSLKPNIYIMYMPWYDYVSIAGVSFTHVGGDIIDINNPKNLAFNLFLIKQYTDGSTTTYNARVSLNQSRADLKSNAKVFSNAKEDFTNELGAELSGVLFRKVGTVMSTPQNFAGYIQTVSGSENDVVSKTAKNRIYDVTIKIYENSSDKLVGTFNTTKLQ